HSTSSRQTSLSTALAGHARRIMATLIYARSQRNNHLLSEAAGVYTAGLLLQGMPGAIKWKRTGWKLFIDGIRDQIAPDGSYIQHSTSYHRLMLHLAIWVQALSCLQEACIYPDDVRQKLILATHWLENLVLSDNGHVPNMGANDGSNILPLGGTDVLDYRPVLRLAKNAFLKGKTSIPASKDLQPEQVVIMKDGEQTACMRVARYRGRPSHADQLHLDLWWRNRDIALDAGTYRYNYPAPWENALSGTICHNTISIDDCDQMVRAGRFLWLRQAKIHNLVLHRDSRDVIRSMSAVHDGYRQLGITHERTVESKPGGEPGWFIKDELLPNTGIKGTQPHTARLVWLLPDWEWELDHLLFHLHSPEGMIRLDFSVNGTDEKDVTVSVFRAGTALTSSNETRPTWGWYSPTYGVKEPALAIHVLAKGNLPMQLITRWHLPE
ncbi:MAG: alginate lyase family protein, partial [Anaerolineaceae bacterium]